VSLLLDALKRAEQEKLSRQGEHAPAPADKAPANATAAPAKPEGERAAPAKHEAGRAAPAARGTAPATKGATPAKAASLELQPLAGVAPAAGARAQRSEAEAANAAMHAKSSRPRSRSGILWAIAGVTVVAVIAASAYVWYSIEALRPQQPAVARVRPPSAPLPPVAVAAGKIEAPAAIATLPSRSAAEPTPAPAPKAPSPRADATEQVVAELLRQAAVPGSTSAPLRLARSVAETPRIPAEVSAGYEQLRSGNLAGARRSYAAALASDPANLDAHLGLATIEARGGDRVAAARHYRRALELDPRNATALAGLAALADYSQPEALESQLRADIARNPQSAALHFTLGNLYAAQSRWGEAQAAFFEAYRLQGGSADIAFNLAVALDHLGQRRLAADYYRRALEARQGQASQFDPAAVSRRLADLGP